jgi:hypothetical protein
MSFLIDTSVFAGYWPFRHLNHRDPEQLKQYLLSRGVAQAWVSSAEAILYPDPMQGNWPLLMATREDAFFVPVTLVDITLATWRKDAEQCITRLGSRAIKVTPNYHSYPFIAHRSSPRSKSRLAFLQAIFSKQPNEMRPLSRSWTKKSTRGTGPAGSQISRPKYSLSWNSSRKEAP